jgi:hypothetical protein
VTRISDDGEYEYYYEYYDDDEEDDDHVGSSENTDVQPRQQHHLRSKPLKAIGDYDIFPLTNKVRGYFFSSLKKSEASH